LSQAARRSCAHLAVCIGVGVEAHAPAARGVQHHEGRDVGVGGREEGVKHKQATLRGVRVYVCVWWWWGGGWTLVEGREALDTTTAGDRRGPSSMLRPRRTWGADTSSAAAARVQQVQV
jgi:hypothetical protein